MIAAALAALALATASPSGLVYGSTSGFSDAFGDELKDGRVVEVHVSGMDDGSFGPDERRTTFTVKEFEYLFPSRSVHTGGGHYRIDGKFRAHAGGMNRGIASWAFTSSR